MNGEIEDFVNLYTECSQIPSPACASILSNCNDNIIIQSKWNFGNVTRSETVNFVQNYTGKKNLDDSFSFKTIGLPVEIASETLSAYSPSRKCLAVLRKVLNKKGEEKQYIEIWSNDIKIKTVDLQELEAHGKVYDDGEFACLDWSHSEDRIVYIAEQKKLKSKSFFKQRHGKDNTDTSKQEIKMGTEDYASEEDWGEKLVSKHHPVVCVMDITSGDVVVLDSIPEDISPGQAIWSPDDSSIICVGWKEEPRRLGITFCINRRSSLYSIDLETAKCTMFGEEDRHVRTPRFSKDGNTLIFLQNDAGGPHFSGSKLMKCDWKTKEISLVVDTVDRAEGNLFTGIYTHSLPVNCWSKDSQYVILHTIWRSNQKIICVNISNKEVKVISEDGKIGAWEVMDIWNDKIIASCSSPNLLPHMRFAELNFTQEDMVPKWCRIDSMNIDVPDISWSVITLNPPYVNNNYSDLDYESILVKPTVHMDPSPLIVCPHGGPHSAFSVRFHVYTLFFAKLGFAILQVNYRGSIGYGENSVLSLLGNVGTQDVQDVQFAADTVIQNQNIDRSKIILFGGSHGGFLVTHLSGQYPDFYKLCICRNPVIDIGCLVEISDIPDWSWAVCGKQFRFDAVPDTEILKEMFERSPVRYVDKVKIPTLLLLGRNDRRVPPSQGLKYYNILKARQIPTRLIMYDDSHPLSKTEVGADLYIQCLLWIKQHLYSEK